MTCINNILPSSVEVVFPKLVCGVGFLAGDYVVSVDLADLDWSSNLEGVTGFDGTKTFHETMPALYGTSSSSASASPEIPSNLDDLQALAKKVACDYYSYQSVSHDVVYNGITPWNPEGISDYLEFVYDGEDVSTRITGKPINGDPEELAHTEWDCHVSSSSAYTQVKVTDIKCESGSLNVYGVTLGYANGETTLNSVSAPFFLHTAGCCTCCKGSVIVEIGQTNCNSTPVGVVVTLTFGSTTESLSAPNDGAYYNFVWNPLTPWTSGQSGTITVTGSNIVTFTKTFTLTCSQQTIIVNPTQNYVLVELKGCLGDTLNGTVSATQSGVEIIPLTDVVAGGYTQVPVIGQSDGTSWEWTVNSMYFDQLIESTPFPYNNCQVTFIMNPASPLNCCDCNIPTCPQLEITCNIGTVTVNWDTSGSFQGYYGYITANVDAYPITPGSGPFPNFTNEYQISNCSAAMTPGLPVTFLFEYVCFVGGQVGAINIYYANCGAPPSGIGRKAWQDTTPGTGGGIGYYGNSGTFSGEPVGTPVTITNCSPGMTGTAPPVTDDYYFGSFTITEVGCSPYEGLGLSMLSKPELPPFPEFQPSDKIRVGFVSPCLIHGGDETWIASVAKSLDDRFVVQGVGIHGSTVDSSVVQSYSSICPVSQGYEEVRKLAFNSDILIIWGSHPYISNWRNNKNKPFILSVCHIPPEWDEGLYKDVTDIDGFVAVSNTALQVIPESVRSKAVVIPNAVDESRLQKTRTRKEVRESWGIESKDFVVGYLGRLSNEKNPLAMVDLGRELKASGLGYQVVIVGSGFQAEEVQAAAEGMDNVHVVGPDHRAGDVLRAFDTLIVPSQFESYGLSIVEATALGIPVISTKVGVAKVVPGLTRIIPVPATGKSILKAIQADLQDHDGTLLRKWKAERWTKKNASLRIFGKRWSDHLARLNFRKNIQPIRSRVRPAGGCGCRGKRRS